MSEKIRAIWALGDAIRDATVDTPNGPRSVGYYISVGIDSFNHPHGRLQGLLNAAAEAALDFTRISPCTDEDVERVARAICAARGGDPDECISGYSWEAGEMGRAEAGSVCHQRNWERFAPEARAAISAMNQIRSTDHE